MLVEIMRGRWDDASKIESVYVDKQGMVTVHGSAYIRFAAEDPYKEVERIAKAINDARAHRGGLPMQISFTLPNDQDSLERLARQISAMAKRAALGGDETSYGGSV